MSIEAKFTYSLRLKDGTLTIEGDEGYRELYIYWTDKDGKPQEVGEITRRRALKIVERIGLFLADMDDEDDDD